MKNQSPLRFARLSRLDLLPPQDLLPRNSQNELGEKSSELNEAVMSLLNLYLVLVPHLSILKLVTGRS